MFFDLRKRNMVTNSANKRGFSLVEVLVSIALISLAVTGPIVVSEYNFKTSVFAKEKVTAGFLATEALEYTRYLITANNLAGNSWLDSLGECLGEDNWCGYDPTNSTVLDKVISCADTTDDCLLYIGNSNGIYTHKTGGAYTKTQFRRKINIIDSGNNAKVTVKVIWDSRGFKDGSFDDQELVLTELFFDWRSQPSN